MTQTSNFCLRNLFPSRNNVNFSLVSMTPTTKEASKSIGGSGLSSSTPVKILFLLHMHRRSTRRKAIARALQSVPEYKFHYLRSSSSLMCRLNGDKALARDLLILLCQTQTRNDNRIANATKKQAGEAVKRGRRPKPKVEALSNGSTFLFSYVD